MRTDYLSFGHIRLIIDSEGNISVMCRSSLEFASFFSQQIIMMWHYWCHLVSKIIFFKCLFFRGHYSLLEYFWWNFQLETIIAVCKLCSISSGVNIMDHTICRIRLTAYGIRKKSKRLVWIGRSCPNDLMCGDQII